MQGGVSQYFDLGPSLFFMKSRNIFKNEIKLPVFYQKRVLSPRDHNKKCSVMRSPSGCIVFKVS